MNAQTVLLVVTFLAAATLALGASVPNGPSDQPSAGVPVPDSSNRNAKHVLGQPGPVAVTPGDGEIPDDLKADGFFWGGYGGYRGGWGGYPGYYRRYGYGYGYPSYGGYGGYYGW